MKRIFLPVLLLLHIGSISMIISSAAAQQPVPIDIVIFRLGVGLPIYTAIEKGWYEQQGLRITLSDTPNSPYLVSNLANQKFNIAMASMDNFIAYQENQHITKKIPGEDLFVFMGLSQTNLALVTQPGIKSYKDLIGKKIAVDSASTGFAFVLFKMLENSGLNQSDYSLLSVGATDRRWELLKQNEFAATLLTPVYANQAKFQGYRILEWSLDILNQYQGVVLAANRNWAAENPQIMEKFIAGTLMALDWIYNPDNQEETAAILAKYISGLDLQSARRSLSGLIARRVITPDGSLHKRGVNTVLALRSQYNSTKKQLLDDSKYVDMSYYDAAVKLRQLK